MSQQGKDVLGGLASLLPGGSTIQGAKNAYDRVGQIPGMVGAIAKKIEDNYYTPEMRKMGIEPDPRFAALKNLSQNNEQDFQNVKDFGEDLAMIYGGKLLRAFGKGAKKTSGMSNLATVDKRKADKVVEGLNKNPNKESFITYQKANLSKYTPEEIYSVIDRNPTLSKMTQGMSNQQKRSFLNDSLDNTFIGSGARNKAAGKEAAIETERETFPSGMMEAASGIPSSSVKGNYSNISPNSATIFDPKNSGVFGFGGIEQDRTLKKNLINKFTGK